jgi:acyl carrier protein
MNQVGPDGLRVFLHNYLKERLTSQGREAPKELADDCDLLLSEIIDSLGLLDLMAAIQEHYGREIDFDAIDPDQITIVGPLCRFVAQQLSNPRLETGGFHRPPMKIQNEG